ncbi:MAG: 30S ribosomal protein S19 [Planctomycetes bacterium]|nr:30S ribosomal protein S19 [Planctomycetota bacterium]
MGRSLKKGPSVDIKLMRKVIQQKNSGSSDAIKTWSRASMIAPDFIGHAFAIHNGKAFHTVTITEDMVGHRLGEFAITRNFKTHTKK